MFLPPPRTGQAPPIGILPFQTNRKLSGRQVQTLSTLALGARCVQQDLN